MKRNIRKDKKRISGRINPEKSNKMIWAVSFGLLLIFGALIIFITNNDLITDKKEVMKKTLGYLKKTKTITSVEFLHETNQVKIFYAPENNSKNIIDYKKMIIFAGIKLSNELKDEKIQIKLFRKKKSNEEFSVTALNGKLL